MRSVLIGLVSILIVGTIAAAAPRLPLRELVETTTKMADQVFQGKSPTAQGQLACSTAADNAGWSCPLTEAPDGGFCSANGCMAIPAATPATTPLLIAFGGYLQGATDPVTVKEDIAVYSHSTAGAGSDAFTHGRLAWAYTKAGSGVSGTFTVEIFKNHGTRVSYVTGIACDSSPGTGSWTSDLGVFENSVTAADTISITVDSGGCGGSGGYPNATFTLELGP